MTRSPAARIVFVVSPLLACTSCIPLTQEVWVNSDRSGRALVSVACPRDAVLVASAQGRDLPAEVRQLMQEARTPLLGDSGIRSAVVRERREAEQQVFELEVELNDVRALSLLGRSPYGPRTERVVPGARIESLPNGRLLFNLDTRLLPGGTAPDWVSRMRMSAGLLGVVPADREVTVRVHAPRVVASSGRRVVDGAIEWRLPLRDVLAPERSEGSAPSLQGARALPEIRAEIDLSPIRWSLILGLSGAAFVIVGAAWGWARGVPPPLAPMAAGLAVPLLCVGFYSLLRDDGSPAPAPATTPPAVASPAAPGAAFASPVLPVPTVTPDVGPLIAALQSGEKAGRLRAANRLGALGTGAREAVPSLLAAVDDVDAGVGAAAIRALAAIGPDATTGRALLDRLSKADLTPDLRLELACAVASSPHAAFALGSLEPALGSGGEVSRARAAECLGSMGRAARSSVPALAALLSGPWSRYARYHAATALGHIGAEAAIALPALQRAAEDEDAYVSRAAKAALEEIRAAATPPP